MKKINILINLITISVVCSPALVAQAIVGSPDRVISHSNTASRFIAHADTATAPSKYSLTIAVGRKVVGISTTVSSFNMRKTSEVFSFLFVSRIRLSMPSARTSKSIIKRAKEMKKDAYYRYINSGVFSQFSQRSKSEHVNSQNKPNEFFRISLIARKAIRQLALYAGTEVQLLKRSNFWEISKNNQEKSDKINLSIFNILAGGSYEINNIHLYGKLVFVKNKSVLIGANINF